MFFKRPNKTGARTDDEDGSLGIIKKLIIAIFVLVVGATLLAKFTGSNKVERGSLTQDAPCVATTECDNGHICNRYNGNNPTCKERCNKTADCPEGHQCKPVVRLNKKKVKPTLVCVSDEEL